MTSRLAELDRAYLRRMAVTLPVAALALTTVLFLVPAERVTALQRRTVGIRGPMRILPELDIVPEEESERRLTAARVEVPRSDFVALELVYDREVEPEKRPEPVPKPEVAKEDKVEFLTSDDAGDAVRTTGLPVPAQSELEVTHVERPVYPPSAIHLGIEGTVEILMLVDRDGRVNQVYVVDPHKVPLLERAAVEAAYKYRFKPYLVNGTPSLFWVKLPFTFHLVG